ncbi:unnamed protein product [Triticum turgidum subsp. durum]|uniref:Uncharacterized protein n=1 Tax=Triticum turgidum subsp. durum TaxID=4567 RepID=A0A9R1BAL5_TRITD|nr:unnamed protein product [Triticum turgidum subsp. durum]
MRILVGRPLKQPPNYTSEDFMVPVVTGAMNPDYGVEPFEDKGCCKGLNEVIIYGTSDFVTICKDVYVRTRRVRLLGLEGAGKTSLIKAMLGQLKERNNAVLECIHVDLHGKAVSNGLCYLDSATVKLQVIEGSHFPPQTIWPFILLISWKIWGARNAKAFHHVDTHSSTSLRLMIYDLYLWSHRICKANNKEDASSWRSFLVTCLHVYVILNFAISFSCFTT